MLLTIYAVALMALLGPAQVQAAPQAQTSPQVKLGQTTFVGRDITGLNLEFFGGIPFAEPPVGDLRFRAPVLKTRLSSMPAILGKPVSNLYGGGFVIGSGNIYNASDLVAYSVQRGTPIIYVNFNYRLGPLGYPQGQEADDQGQLNLALKDQLTALEWVQANIGFFGGDKNKVTLFGESAGAMMTGVLYFSPQLEGLVRGAIFQSGSANSPLTFNAARREGSWQAFVSGVASCASLATSGNTLPCLRSATTPEIYGGFLQSLASAPEAFPWDPTIDSRPGSLYPDIASRLYARGQFARIPFIAGTNLDEGTFFAIRRPGTTEADLRANLVASYSPPLVNATVLEGTVDRLLELYPDVPALGSPYNTGDELFGLPSSYKRDATMHGDLSFESTRRLWIQSATKFGVKTYGYLFTQPQPLGDPSLGVVHGSEIPFVYGFTPDPSPSAQKLKTMMMDYWISFTVNLNPNDHKGVQRPSWPRYTTSNQVLLQLNGDNITLINDDYREEQIAFLNSNAAVFHH